jgi:benzoate/toluate 1,2-dioxygenase beta subunit
MRARIGVSEPAAADLASSVLFWEARLLDMRCYRDWLTLLTEDCIYWVPATPDLIDPRAESAVNFDDRRRVVDRIALIETGALHAQMPPSRTCRMISNIEAWTDGAGAIEVRSNLALWDYRKGQTTSYVGWQEHRLVERAARWLIGKKVINLLNCDQPQGNITFVL